MKSYRAKRFAEDPDRERARSREAQAKSRAKRGATPRPPPLPEAEAHARAKLRSKAWYEANKSKVRPAWRAARYAMTPAEVEALLAKQGGRCAICGADDPGPRGFVVDHDHATGRVRGMLCVKCNTGIGLLRDDPALLRRALEYLSSVAPKAVA